MELLTLGHGTLEQPELAALIRSSGITRLVDVRTVPQSRTHPWVWSERMAVWVPEEAGAAYCWEPALGGFRKPGPHSHNTALRNSAFRGYADYMETAAFGEAMRQLVKTLSDAVTAIMCSETLWWRCHRRLIADAAVMLYGIDVRHLSPKAKAQPHVLTQGVRRAGDALRYDQQAA